MLSCLDVNLDIIHYIICIVFDILLFLVYLLINASLFFLYNDETPAVDESDLVVSAAHSSSNDLSSLPSIMTRTSRLTAPSYSIANKQSILGASAGVSKPALITSAAILNHTLTVKTSGFADLSFIDFSCTNFPRIAQNYCELWPRKLQFGGSVVLFATAATSVLAAVAQLYV